MMESWTDKDSGLIWSLEDFGEHDYGSAEELADESDGWRLPTIPEWLTLVKNDMTLRDSVPFKDNGIYWSSSVYIHNPDQKAMVADFSAKNKKVYAAYTSRINYKKVRLVKG
jgi:hypothetical protein